MSYRVHQNPYDIVDVYENRSISETTSLWVFKPPILLSLDISFVSSSTEFGDS